MLPVTELTMPANELKLIQSDFK